MKGTEFKNPTQANLEMSRFRVNLKTIIVLVACCAAIIWAWRVVWESVPANRMVSTLQSGTVEGRRIAARDLSAATPEELGVAIPALIPALADEDSEVAVEAARGLGVDALAAIRTRDGGGHVTAASEALSRALSDGRAELRAAAVRSLGLIGSKAAIAPPAALIRVLRNDHSPEIRAAAATALGRFHLDVDDAIRPLFDALVEDDVLVRNACNAALGAAAFQPSPKMVPYLIKSLREGRDLRERYRAASLLGRLGPAAREAVPVLIATLKEAPGPRPVTLLPTFNGPGGSGGVMAPRALGSPPPEETPTDWDPACESAVALGLIAKGTGSSGTAVAALAEALGSEHVWRRGAAARGLMPMGREGSAAVPALAEALSEAVADPDDRGNESWIPQALAQVAPGSATVADAVKALTEALGAKHDGTRMYAADALGRLGPAASAAVPRLRTLLNDSHSFESETARKALDSIEAGAKSPDKPPL